MKNGVITVLITLFVVGVFFLYVQKTIQQRTYVAEIKQLRLMKEHQTLQIEVMKANAEIEDLKATAKKKTPIFHQEE